MTPPLCDRRPRAFRIGDEIVSVRVRESRRARFARIIVGPRRPLEVIVPKRLSASDVDSFLEEKRPWIERKVAASREIAERVPQLGLDGAVRLAGEVLSIHRTNGKRSLAYLKDGELVLAGPEEDATRAIERWYRREARRRFAEVAARQSVRLGFAYKAIGIRDQRTRWGSCSRMGNLSFSWRLLVAPAEVLEYVVVHELCHLREPNHSKAFWRLLEAAYPGWQAQARWLREHGQELHDYRPISTS